MSQDEAPGRWMPSPLLYASGAVHLGAAAAVLARPRVWPWALGAALLALCVGIALGALVLDWHIRRKYGGLRIY